MDTTKKPNILITTNAIIFPKYVNTLILLEIDDFNENMFLNFNFDLIHKIIP